MSDQERAFDEWLRTGEIPDWRRRQLEDAALHSAVGDLQADLKRLADLSVTLPWSRLLVTRLVDDDDEQFYDAPLIGSDGDTGERQLLCSHATYSRLMTGVGVVDAHRDQVWLYGLPVVVESDPTLDGALARLRAEALVLFDRLVVALRLDPFMIRLEAKLRAKLRR